MSIQFTSMPEKANAVTHAGNFHADDIFSMILLEKVFDKLVVFRKPSTMTDITNIRTDAIIFDIGYGEFDHHQKNGNGNHPTNDTSRPPIPYASFGLLWRKFGHILCDELSNNNPEKSSKLWEYIEYNLVLGIDAIDNGIYPQSPCNYNIHRIMTVSNVISMFNPYTNQGETIANALTQALFFARFVFDLVIDRALNEINGISTNYTNNAKFFTAEQVFSFALLKKIYPLESDKNLLNFERWNNDNIKFHAPTQNAKDITNQPIPAGIMGKIWEEEGMKYCNSILDSNYPEYVCNFIRSYLIMGIDAQANGIVSHGHPNFVDYNIITISDFIEFLNPTVYSEKAYNNCWTVAVKFAQIIINRVESKVIDRITGRKYVEEKIKESLKNIPSHKRSLSTCSSHILIFDRHVHWQDWVSNCPDARNIWFVISPSNKGGYIVQPVPCKYNKNGYRKGFPKKWYGLNGEALRAVTKVPTASFVHPKDGFIGGAEDLQGAIQLAERAFSNIECTKKI